MNQRSPMPGWLAPWVGALVCAGLSWKAIYRMSDGPPPSFGPAFIAGGAAVGFVIGLLLWWRDSRRGD